MNDTDIIINHSVATWSMPPTQGVVNGTYIGTFTFRCYLSPIQLLSSGREYRELLGNNAILASEHDGYLCYALTTLKHRVISSPPFWKTSTQNGGIDGDIPDENIILLVLDAAIRSEQLFKNRITKERDKVLEKTIQTAEEMLQKESGEE